MKFNQLNFNFSPKRPLLDGAKSGLDAGILLYS